MGTNIKALALFLLFLVTLYSFGVSPSLFLISSGLVATFLFGWLIYREYQENVVKFTPVLVLFIIPFLMLGVAAIYHGYLYIDQPLVSIGSDVTSPESIVIGYLIISVGLVFQYLGIICFRINKSTEANKIQLDSDSALLRYFVLFLIIAKATEYFNLGVIQTLLNLVPLSILIYAAVKHGGSEHYNFKRNFIIISSVVLFVGSLISLSKSNMVFTLLPILLFYVIHSPKKYKVGFVCVAAVIAYLLFIQPLVVNGRKALQQNVQEIQFTDIYNYVTSGDYYYAASGDFEQRNNNSFEILLSRIFEVNAPAYIYDRTEISGFKYGETFSSMAYAMIPRVFWKDKPNVTQGDKFAKDYFYQSNNNIGMLISGELYWNFGFYGVIIGCFILGLVIGYLWKVIFPFAFENFIYFTIYFYLLQSCLGGPEFSAVFLGILQLIIVFWMIRFIDNVFSIMHNEINN